MESPITRNGSIDVLKIVCAVLVVLIHSQHPFSEYYKPVLRCAVPCFFMMSGYMMKGETLDGKLRTRIARMSWLLLWSTCFYACFKVLMHHREPTFAVVPTCEQLKAFIYFNANPFGGHLWYISAYIYVCALCLLINKFNMWKIAYMSVPILLLMNLVLDCYSVALFRHSFPIYYARNFLLVGMPFTLIGKYLSENKCEMIKTTWGG